MVFLLVTFSDILFYRLMSNYKISPLYHYSTIFKAHFFRTENILFTSNQNQEIDSENNKEKKWSFSSEIIY